MATHRLHRSRLEGVEGLHTVVTPEGMAYRRMAAEPAGPQRRRRTASPPLPPRQASRGRSVVSAPRRPDPVDTAPGHSAGTPAAASAADVGLASARHALARGDYEGAATAAAALVAGAGGAEAHVILVRALGSAGRLAVAADAAAAAVALFPVHVELRLLQAIVLLESADAPQAEAAARAAAYLDPGLAMAHLTLARAEDALGDQVAARRSYRNALAVLEVMPADHPGPVGRRRNGRPPGPPGTRRGFPPPYGVDKGGRMSTGPRRPPAGGTNLAPRDGSRPFDHTQAILDERARALARPARVEQSGDLVAVVAFAIGGVRHAFEARFVREVLVAPDVSTVPSAPPAVVGVTNVRGEILTIADISALLGVAAQEDRSSSWTGRRLPSVSWWTRSTTS